MSEYLPSEQDSLYYGQTTQRQVQLPLHLIINDEKVEKEEIRTTERNDDHNIFKYQYKRTNSDTVQKVKNTTKNFTPKNDHSIDSFSQIFNFESDNGIGRKSQGNIGVTKSRRGRPTHHKKQKSIQVEEEASSMHHQQFMRRIFNRIRTQMLVKQFTDKMMSLLKRNQLIAFQSKKEFFNILNDKAAFFDPEILQRQERITSSDETNNVLRKSATLQQSQMKYIQRSQKYATLSNCMRLMIRVLDKVPIFSTFSKIKLLWDLIQLACVGFFFMVIPIIIVFKLDAVDILGQEFIHLVLIAVLIVDLLVNFNTSLFMQGKEIKDHYRIVSYYLHSGFTLDLSTLISLVIFFSFAHLRNQYVIEVISNIVLIIFFLRFHQFKRFLKKIEIQYHFSPQITQALRLINLILMNIYIIHILACFWIQIANWQAKTDNWLEKFNLLDSVWYIQFLNSFYFNTVTMVTVGYGDISPQTDFERLFSVITVLSACCVFGYSISEVRELISRKLSNLPYKF